MCTFLVFVALMGTPERPVAAPKIQLALLLDTSNSMDGLIEQAKAQLWKIVNTLARTKRQGKPTELEVALYEYGNSRLSAGVGYIRLVVPLTNDLDRLSAELFKLSTCGGEEFCGMTIQASLRELSWSSRPEDLKIIYIAGNEPFTQGPVHYTGVCQAARNRTILVNTIHCGPRDAGITGRWQDGAVLGGGTFAVLNQDQKIPHISCPQDETLLKLNQKLNETYVPYGRAGQAGKELQTRQDGAAYGLAASNLAERTNVKASRLYNNSMWDLVDALKTAKVKLEEIKEEEFPAEMRGMNPEQRKAFVEAKAKQRQGLQEQIKALSAAREQHVANERRRLGSSKDKLLDDIILDSLRRQAQASGLQFE